jgi:hypothetical protein
MTLTKHISPFTQGTSPIQIFQAPVAENQKDETIRELRRILNNWDYQLKYWSKEYQALQRILDFNGMNAKAQENATAEACSPFKKAMEQQLPELEAFYRSCRLELNSWWANPSADLAEKAERIRQLDQQLWAFKKEMDKYKLEFFQSLYADIPLAIY